VEHAGTGKDRYAEEHQEAIVIIDVVASRQAELEVLCEEYGERRLALFGSAAKGTWGLAAGWRMRWSQPAWRPAIF
jgi:hypothetical protein